MRAWQFSLLGWLCLASCGCRTDPNIALLERQNRTLEDKVYELREVIEDYQSALDRAPTAMVPSPAGSAMPPEPLPTPAQRPASPRPLRPSATAPPVEPKPPAVTLPGVETTPEDALERLRTPSSPRIIPPNDNNSLPGKPDAGPSAPPGEAPPFSRSNRPAPMPAQLTAVGPAASASRAPAGARASEIKSAGPPLSLDSRQVATVTLNPRLTSGYRSASGPADEGIRVVVEPRDAHNRLVEAAGAVSVVLIDPAQDDQSARVARWDFPADATAVMFRRTGSADGIELELPWPGTPPVHAELRLFVRFTTSDGRKLQAEQPIRVNLAGATRPDWTAAAPLLQSPPNHSAAAPPSVPTPAVRLPSSTAARPASLPTPAATAGWQRPVWSPNRR